MPIKQFKLWLPSLLVLVLVPLSFWALAQENSKTGNTPKNQAAVEPVVETDLVLYYGDGCPHCQIVEDYLAQAEPKSQTLSMVRKEVYNNSVNQRELIAHAKQCGIDDSNIGIPLLWDNQNKNCLVGDQDIIVELKTRLK